MTQPRLVTAKELAEELRVSEKALYRWVAQDKIARFRLPSGQVRFPIDEILETLREHDTEGTAA